ncbi:MAG: 50S ribosomal protein L15 [Waddliaceae bacterium]
MVTLSTLKNTSRTIKARKRVGRGIGSGHGKTCGRGYKGQGARAGARRRYGYEGGQMRLFQKLPTRGFSNARYTKRFTTVNLGDIEKVYIDGETVNLQTLIEKGFLIKTNRPLKILGEGNLTKKVEIEAHAFSQTAQDKLKKAKVKSKQLS